MAGERQSAASSCWQAMQPGSHYRCVPLYIPSAAPQIHSTHTRAQQAIKQRTWLHTASSLSSDSWSCTTRPALRLLRRMKCSSSAGALEPRTYVCVWGGSACTGTGSKRVQHVGAASTGVACGVHAAQPGETNIHACMHEVAGRQSGQKRLRKAAGAAAAALAASASVPASAASQVMAAAHAHRIGCPVGEDALICHNPAAAVLSKQANLHAARTHTLNRGSGDGHVGRGRGPAKGRLARLGCKYMCVPAACGAEHYSRQAACVWQAGKQGSKREHAGAHPLALLEAQRLQAGGELQDLLVQLPEGADRGGAQGEGAHVGTRWPCWFARSASNSWGSCMDADKEACIACRQLPGSLSHRYVICTPGRRCGSSIAVRSPCSAAKSSHLRACSTFTPSTTVTASSAHALLPLEALLGC